jgi:acyl-coenzyme A synthetase/AMP-(fatty) acid ligase
VLTHLGRLDSQVKIRGFRVELPEIEGALRLHPNVSDAAVFAVPGRAGSHELAAFYVGAATDARELRNHLAQTLPAYMVPRRLVRLASFPLTSNGKVDRLALATLLPTTEGTVHNDDADRRRPADPGDSPAVLVRDSGIAG